MIARRRFCFLRYQFLPSEHALDIGSSIFLTRGHAWFGEAFHEELVYVVVSYSPSWKSQYLRTSVLYRILVCKISHTRNALDGSINLHVKVDLWEHEAHEGQCSLDWRKE